MSETEQQIMFRKVVTAELSHWVTNASRGVIDRAAASLGQPAIGGPVRAECPGDRHAYVNDWVAHLFVLQCCTCGRIRT
jgi:hypothetical protein